MANEKRLIDANAIKYHKETECFGHGDFRVVRKVYKEEIDKLPTVDAVEVVRCKDCKHYCQYPKVDKPKARFVHPLTPHFMPEDGFCSNGERKEDG